MKIRRWHLLLATGATALTCLVVSYKLSKTHPMTQGIFPISVTRYARTIVNSSVEADEKMSLPFGEVEELRIRTKATDVSVMFTERIHPAGVEPSARVRLKGRFFRELEKQGSSSQFLNSHRNGSSYAIGVLEPRAEKSRDFEGLATLSIELPTTFNGKFSIETASGDIEVNLRGSTFGKLNANTSNGDLSIDPSLKSANLSEIENGADGKSLKGQLGNEKGEISLSSMSGSVRIKNQ